METMLVVKIQKAYFACFEQLSFIGGFTRSCVCFEFITFNVMEERRIKFQALWSELIPEIQYIEAFTNTNPNYLLTYGACNFMLAKCKQ